MISLKTEWLHNGKMAISSALKIIATGDTQPFLEWISSLLLFIRDCKFKLLQPGPNQKARNPRKNNTDKEKDPCCLVAEEMLSRADVQRINGPRPWDIRVKNSNLFRRVLNEGSLGLGESYMDGWWECEDLDEFYRISKHRLYDYIPSRWSDIFRLAMARLFNLQSKIRARKVCDVHYNLGNDLFAQMLDPHMQYSCGYWDGATTLEEAQKNKLRMICEKLQLEPGMRLLDIGCGWGGLAEYAARHYDVTVVGVSNSSEQVELARGRCKGLNVEILLSDYRDLDPDQRFDRVVSVGMFEYVGPKNYDLFFSIVDRCLAPDGIFLLHTIGSNTTVTKLG